MSMRREEGRPGFALLCKCPLQAVGSGSAKSPGIYEDMQKFELCCYKLFFVATRVILR